MSKPALKTIIGLEVHVQLNTKSKMFCSCPNVFGDIAPNTAICPICLGYPGTLPLPNEASIISIQRVGAALNCQLATHSKFDRKHYFYPDLPKGYQISQYDQPFCGPGKVPIIVDGQRRSIGITRAHLEEDAAKNTHPAGANYTLVDYNRAGTPLVEIVTEPDLRSPAEAKIFLQELRRIMKTLRVSTADMSKGQLRCDANISLREPGSDQLNPKTEIKNLNSFRHVERALQYEIIRLTKLFQQDKLPRRETTRGFNADTGLTTEQRGKEGAADYRYFPEPDIPPFVFTLEEINARVGSLPELPHAQRQRLISQYAISEQSARLFIDHQELSSFFESTVSELQQLDNDRLNIDPKDLPFLSVTASHIILRQLRDLLIKHQLAPAKLNITPANFAELVVIVYLKQLNQNNLPDVLTAMQSTGGDPDHIIKDLGLSPVSDQDDLIQAVDQVMSAHPDVVAKIKSGKTSATQFLIGQVMARLRGRANPEKILDIIKNKIDNNSK